MRNIMNEIEIYKYNKTEELNNALQPYVKKLIEEYNTNFNISVNYDNIRISGNYSELPSVINTIRNDIINFAKENLDENFNIILDTPATITGKEGIRSDSIVEYSIERELKENEPE